MNPYGRPKVAIDKKRVSYTCTIAPATRRMLSELKCAGIKTNLGRKIDALVKEEYKKFNGIS